MPIDNLSKITSRSGINTTILLEAGNANVTGIVTAAGFDGPFTGGGTIAAGIITGTGLEITGISTFNGNVNIENGNISIKNTSDDESFIYFTHSSIANRRSYVGSVEGTGNSNSLVFATNDDGADAEEKVRIDSDGKVGIGITNPYYNLQVNFNNSATALSGGTSGFWGGAGIRIENDNTTVGAMALAHFRVYDADWHIGNKYVGNNDSDFVFNHEGIEKVRIDSDGNLGIGTDTVDFKLQVQTGTHKFISFTDAEHGSLSDLGSAIIFSRPSNGAKKICGIFQHTNQSLAVAARDDLTFHTGGNAFYYSGSERFRISANGRVSVGNATNNASPTAVFGVIADDGEAADLYVGKFQNNEETAGQSYGVDIRAGSNSTDHGFRVKNRANDTTQLIVRGDGNIGIGTDSPTGKLEIDAASTTDMIMLDVSGTNFARIGHNSSSGTAVLDVRSEGHTRFLTGGNSEKVRITSGGNVLIDTTVTTEVSGDFDDLIIGSTSDTSKGISIVGSTTGGVGSLTFTDGASYKNQGIIQYRHADDSMRFTTGQYEALRILSTGDVGIGTTNPQVKLTVSSTSPAVCDIHHKDGGTNDEARLILGALANNPPSNRGAGIAAVNNGAGHDLIIKCSASHAAGPSEKVRVTSAGKVGINIVGTDNTSPVRNLDIADPSGAILRLISSDDSLGANERIGAIEFYTDDDDGGHIGAAITAISDPSDSFGRRGALVFGTQSTESTNAVERVRITASGQLAIGYAGTSTIGTLLHIENGSGDAYIRCRGHINKALIFNNSDGGAHGFLGSGGTNGGAGADIAIQSNHGNVKLHTKSAIIDTSTGNDGLVLEPTASASTSIRLNTWEDNDAGRNWAIRNRYTAHGRLEFMRGTTKTDEPLTTVMYLQGTSVHISGTLSKNGGSFKIPHPIVGLSTTKDLVHSFIEGPQMDLIYRGKVTLSSGAATVNLDTVSNMTEGTFVVLNRDVQCFTTNETGWGAVKGSVSGNILTISAQDGSSTDTISWMVIGERQDDTVKSLDMTDDNGDLIVEPLKESVINN